MRTSEELADLPASIAQRLQTPEYRAGLSTERTSGVSSGETWRTYRYSTGAPVSANLRERTMRQSALFVDQPTILNEKGSAISVMIRVCVPDPSLIWPTGPSWLPSAYASLDEIARECQHADWDGEGSPAVVGKVVANVRTFLESLPASSAEPEILPDRDGRIGVDWSRDAKTVVAVSVDANGTLYFASLLSGKRLSGNEELAGTLPAPIALLLDRFHAVVAVNQH